MAGEYNYDVRRGWRKSTHSAGDTCELTSGPGSGGFAVIKVDPNGNLLHKISVGSSVSGEAYGWNSTRATTCT
jgi:hypothetical protein